MDDSSSSTSTLSDEALSDIQVGDSRFLGFVEYVDNEVEAHSYQQFLKKEYPNAAHFAYCWVLPNHHDGSNEDGEPKGSTGPFLLQELKTSVATSDNKTTGLVLVVVRFFGELLLGVTCGRLSQCYSRAGKLALHRFWNGQDSPLICEYTDSSKNLYGMGAGDCELLLDVVTEPKENNNSSSLLATVLKEVEFGGFKGSKGEVLPRLQSLQADVSSGIIPVYRYPGNYTGDEWETYPWSPTCWKIKQAVEETLFVKQEMNHCVVNCYRNGNDFIQHHSDKDLDLHPEGAIVSVSLGDVRILELKRRQSPQDVTRLALPHGSMLVLGPKTNQQFTHSILTNPSSETPRVSLTLRNVTTFMDVNTKRLFGQGVSTKSTREIQELVRQENMLCRAAGFCCATAAIYLVASGKPTTRTTKLNLSLVWILAAEGLSQSIQYLRDQWCKRLEERSARDFFSKSSTSGTKY